MSKSWLFWLEELGQEHNRLVGKKCANLGEMTKMGLRVPPGFALSVDAYKKFMSMTGADDEIGEYLAKFGSDPEDMKQFNELSAGIRQIVLSKTMPQEMEGAIVSYYGELCQKCGGEVAVSTRSAGPVSHPGQYETYLNVIGLELIDKIKAVWASTFNPRSLTFRSRGNLPLTSDPIGVIVLKMVNARTAGIIFTADPNTGDTGRMIIEANWGLGESVVSGEAVPDVLVLDKESLEVHEKKLGQKSIQVIGKEAGVAEEAVPPEKSSSFCLSDEEAKEIGKLARILEEHFGSPQDAEWAIDQDLLFPGNVYLLQTRPVIIAQKKSPADQIVDLMLNRFSTGTG